ncbi:MAG: thioredoxin family protein [Capsulimonadales bacterium]|nr:thioredoxin family protein [Capsulimonadales bacterium]
MKPVTVLFVAVALLVAFPQTGVSAPSDPPAAKGNSTEPEPADRLLKAASDRAKAGKKNVLVVFHASWCSWCKRLDEKLLNDPITGKLLKDHFEVVHLDVLESPERKARENAGGNDLLTKLGGADSGLPFYAVLDPAGRKVSDSNRMPQNGNIGYPATPEEIAAFVDLLKRTAPRLTTAERQRISDHLRRNAPKS